MFDTTAQRLNHFIKYMGLTHREFASELSTSQPSISAMTSGKRPISRGMVARISRKFPKLNVRWLVSGEGDMEKGEQDSCTTIADNSGVILMNSSVNTSSPTECKTPNSTNENEITQLKALLFDKELEITKLKNKVKELKEQIKLLKV